MSKNLLVLGARSDIAQATAYEFAGHGFDIILAARDSRSLDNVRSDIEIRFGVKAFTTEFDAAAFDTHREFYSQLPAKPDVVLFAVGYLGDQERAQTDWAEAEKIIHANYSGGVSILSVVAEDLEKRKTGTIIGTSSVSGDRGRRSNYFYGSAKAGFTTFLSGLRHRLASSNVNVLTVKPGFVATRMTAGMDLPERLTAQPPDVAKAIFRAYEKKKHTLYVLGRWRWVMFVVRNIPERIFVRSKL